MNLAPLPAAATCPHCHNADWFVAEHKPDCPYVPKPVRKPIATECGSEKIVRFPGKARR